MCVNGKKVYISTTLDWVFDDIQQMVVNIDIDQLWLEADFYLGGQKPASNHKGAISCCYCHCRFFVTVSKFARKPASNRKGILGHFLHGKRIKEPNVAEFILALAGVMVASSVFYDGLVKRGSCLAQSGEFRVDAHDGLWVLSPRNIAQISRKGRIHTGYHSLVRSLDTGINGNNNPSGRWLFKWRICYGVLCATRAS
ncbi:hypothetical protein MTR_5g047210 [Medicago truncatula]|uniref:Uncharacterized protein n=1 Tax=Medicago truncatula TaxID=3880 RepID=G7JY58_MEDTR|nr:hypothetical protein MTR_5g047210 [Medicago truncatula]